MQIRSGYYSDFSGSNQKEKKKKYLYKRDKKFFLHLSPHSYIFNMEKLLQWAVNNSDNNSLAEQAAAIRRGEALPDPKRYDPKVLEAILGKDDATRMKGILKHLHIYIYNVILI